MFPALSKGGRDTIKRVWALWFIKAYFFENYGQSLLLKAAG